MAYAFNNDKTKAEVYVKDDFVIVEATLRVQLRQSASDTIDITESIDDADNYALISTQYYIDPSTPGGSQVYVGKWMSLEEYYMHDGSSSGPITEAAVFPRVHVYNDDTDGHHVYAKYWVRNESDRQRDIRTRFVFLKIN